MVDDWSINKLISFLNWKMLLGYYGEKGRVLTYLLLKAQLSTAHGLCYAALTSQSVSTFCIGCRALLWSEAGR